MSDNTNEDADGLDTTDVNHDTDPASHNSSTWKVLGEIDAPDGTAVLGHNTATTGSPIGTEGVVDTKTGAGVHGRNTADADTANDVYPTGVGGTATGTGPTFAV